MPFESKAGGSASIKSNATRLSLNFVGEGGELTLFVWPGWPGCGATTLFAIKIGLVDLFGG